MRENPRPAEPFNHPNHFTGKEVDFFNKGISFDFDDHEYGEEDCGGNWDGQWQDQWNQENLDNNNWSSDADEDWNQDHHYPDEDYYGDWEAEWPNPTHLNR